MLFRYCFLYVFYFFTHIHCSESYGLSSTSSMDTLISSNTSFRAVVMRYKQHNPYKVCCIRRNGRPKPSHTREWWHLVINPEKKVPLLAKDNALLTLELSTNCPQLENVL